MAAYSGLGLETVRHLPPLFRDAQGNEGQFALNHLGHFRLAQRLLPALQRAGGARVVSVSSRGHCHGAMDPELADRLWALSERLVEA